MTSAAWAALLSGQEAPIVPVTLPAYSMRTWSSASFGFAAEPNVMPTQSPAAGAADADVNTIGAAAVPRATSAPDAGFVPVKCSTARTPSDSKRSVTVGSVVRVATGLPGG